MKANKLASILREQYYEGRGSCPQKKMNPMGINKIPINPPINNSPTVDHLFPSVYNKKILSSHTKVNINKKTPYNADYKGPNTATGGETFDTHSKVDIEKNNPYLSHN